MLYNIYVLGIRFLVTTFLLYILLFYFLVFSFFFLSTLIILCYMNSKFCLPLPGGCCCLTRNKSGTLVNWFAQEGWHGMEEYVNFSNLFSIFSLLYLQKSTLDLLSFQHMFGLFIFVSSLLERLYFYRSSRCVARISSGGQFGTSGNFGKESSTILDIYLPWWGIFLLQQIKQSLSVKKKNLPFHLFYCWLRYLKTKNSVFGIFVWSTFL